MENILELINEELENISLELAKKDKTAEFYTKFRKNNPCSNIYDVCDADYVDLAVALIMCNEPDLDVSFVSNAVSKAKGMIDICDKESVAVPIFDFLDCLESMGVYQEAMDIFSKRKKIRVRDLLKNTTLTIKALEDFLNRYKIPASEFVDFMALYREHQMRVFTTYSLIGAFKTLGKEKELRNENIERFSGILGVKVKEKDKNKYINRQISNKWRVNGMMSIVREATNYGQSLESQEASRRKTLMRQKRVYEELIKKLPKVLKGGEIQNYTNLISKVSSERIRLEILKLIYCHNQEIYSSMKREYDYLSANDVTKYRVLLSNNGIDCNNCDISLVMCNSLSDVRDIINILKCLDITDSELMFRILKITNLDTVRKINSIHQSGIIDDDLLKKHPDLFDDSSTIYGFFIQNIDLLREMNINTKCFKESSESLIIPSLIFKKNIQILKDYSLISSIKSNQDYSFLDGNSLHIGIDTLLELGYEKYLVDDLSILNYQDRFKRLRFLKELNIPITSREDLINVLKTDRFYVQDVDINSYLYNAALYNIPSVKRCKSRQGNVSLGLDDFLDGERTYNFGGVLISKNKVKRNCSFLSPDSPLDDRRLYSILQGSVLSDLEVDCIRESLGIEKKDLFVMEKKS